jgi:transcriptional regulator with XRE-family HTH domain
VGEHCPALGKPGDLVSGGEDGDDTSDQIVLFRSRPSPLPLDAYLASALTGLTSAQRDTIFNLSDVIAEVCKAHHINLYEPRKAGTDPLKNPDVVASSVFKIDRERVLRSDLLIHLCHFPSTGAGEELGFAYSALIPIVLVAHNDTHVSRMVTGIPSLTIKLTYRETTDLERQLDDCLFQLRPLLEQRKMAFSKYDVNLVGDKIRMLREELGLTRADVAKAVPELTVEHLQLVEESIDRLSDPSLMLLRRIATVLNTTVADLVEPDLGQTLVAFVENWANSKMAARFPISERDRNRILRRLLRRMIDSLDNE